MAEKEKIKFVFNEKENKGFWYQVGPGMCDNNRCIKGFLSDDGFLYIEYTHSGWSTTLLDAIKFIPTESQVYYIYVKDNKIIVESEEKLNITSAFEAFTKSGLPKVKQS